MNIPDTIRDTIARRGLIPEGSKVVVGVSGGADSVALLRALHQIGLPVTAAHLNHQLRGADSDADEQFVRELADELRIPVVVKSTDVRQRAERSALSIEMAAREARHDFFAEFGGAMIALAHHADDQAETFLLKLARGAGPGGLGGMAYAQTIGPIKLIRPMLNISRAEILDWLKVNQFEWRDDRSNYDETFLRNRVRHTVLPLLEKEMNPNIREAILRTMDILQAEDAWMNQIIADCRLPTSDLPLAAKRRVLRKWLFEQGSEEAGFDAVEKIMVLMDEGRGTRIFELNDRQRVVVEYGVPRFEESGSGSRPDFRLATERGTGWKKDHGQGAGILPAEASFDAEKIGDSPIEVRGWQPGDRMEPLGMEGSRKLQDILTDQKVPKALRPSIPVVVCHGEIIWIPGYRTARGWEVPSPGAAAVHVRISQF